jgi:Fur family peroxide stress response transcriptional regulator
MRNTRQRQVVLDIVRNTSTHPTADWVYEQARQVIPNISLGTVYRLLNRLHEEGLVAQLEVGSRKARFDGNPGDHQHIVCEKCGRIADVPDVIDALATQRIEQTTGFRVSTHRVEWFGVCPECQAQSNRK